MELCSQNLSDMFGVRKSAGKKFSETEIKQYMRDILEGVMCMHSHGYIHRDLKPENILLSEQNELKIADFGTVK